MELETVFSRRGTSSCEAAGDDHHHYHGEETLLFLLGRTPLFLRQIEVAELASAWIIDPLRSVLGMTEAFSLRKPAKISI